MPSIETTQPPCRTSIVGARGLLQIHPDTAAALGVPALDLTDPGINLDTGVALLEQRGEQLAAADPSLMQRFVDGQWDDAGEFLIVEPGSKIVADLTSENIIKSE